MAASTKAAEQTGVINSGQAFSDQAGRHERQSIFWFKATCGCVTAIVGMLGILLFFGCYPLGVEEIAKHVDKYQKFARWDLYVFIACRVGIIFCLFWALSFSAKNYSYHRNKLAENMHRHNIMSTYLASIADLPQNEKAVIARIAFSATFLSHPEIPEKETSDSLISTIKEKVS